MTTTATASPPTIPAEVLAFAAERGASSYVGPVLDMTREVFANRPVCPLLEEDPEIPDWEAIVMQVDVTGMSVEELVAAQRRWSAALFKHCPTTHAHLFAYLPRASS